MRYATRCALALLCLLCGLPAVAAPPEVRWHFSRGVLEMWQLEVLPEAKAEGARLSDPDFPHYQSWRAEAAPGPIGLDWALPGLTLRRGGHTLALPQVRLQLDPERAGLLVADQDGRPWMVADMAHQMPGLQLDWRHLSLRLLPAAARALGEPALAQVIVGNVALRGGPNLSAKGANDCTAGGNWPAPGLPADIALTGLNSVTGFASRDCSGGPCVQPSPTGSTAGEVVVAPDALLVNVGDRDVAWYTKFFPQTSLPPDLPYGSDQHPYLVWALYRQEPNGALVPLGSSGVKHAFFAQNSGCACPGTYVLFPGCGDLYSAATNDMASVLGPRNEIDPRSGRWGRCGSVFDPDCNGKQDGSGFAAPFERRLLAAESELLAAEHPGARWFIEAWYVVRDDANLDNSMAYREVQPAKSGSGWLFPVAGEVTSGPVIQRMANPAAPGSNSRAQRLDLPGGRLQMAVRVESVGSCLFRYHYALMNLDYAHSTFSGSAPDLRMEASVGVKGLDWPFDVEAIGGLVFRDDDRNPANDWTANGSGPLQLIAPANGDLGWGRLASVSFHSTRPPGPGTISVRLGDDSVESFDLLAPTAEGPAFCDGFEQP